SQLLWRLRQKNHWNPGGGGCSYLLHKFTYSWRLSVTSYSTRSHLILSFHTDEETGIVRPGSVAQACNPSTLGGPSRWIMRSTDRDHPGQHGETLSLLKIQKISRAWWRVPVIPATQEAEVAVS
uniref:Uncharacterized protein n=1 Tax=Callithrix jacchus TaxID=9483 RepID=A0A8I3XB60_CALJA